jgi:hypothetical protein
MIENLAKQICEQCGQNNFPEISKTISKLSKSEQIDFYSHVLEYYGGFFSEKVILNSFDSFAYVIDDNINEIIEKMRHNKYLGIQSLGSFFISYTSVTRDEFINAINDKTLLNEMKLFEGKHWAKRILIPSRFSEIKINKILNFKLPKNISNSI